MELFYNILKGIAIGIANVIPGVSGGTVAFLLGIYDRLTGAVAHITKIKGKEKKKEIIFLMQLGIGVFVGILVFAKVIDKLYTNYSSQTSFFFLGLIIASIPAIYKENDEKISLKNLLGFLMGVFIVSIIIYLGKDEIVDDGLSKELTLIYGLKLFFLGSITAGAMVIPGISGSLLLLLSGEYYRVLSYVNNREILPIIIIMGGAGLGLIGFAKIINFMLKKYKSISILFIIGLICASLFKIWPKNYTDSLFGNIFCCIIGIVVVVLFHRFSKGGKDETVW